MNQNYEYDAETAVAEHGAQRPAFGNSPQHLALYAIPI